MRTERLSIDEPIPFPVLQQNDKGDVVRHQQCGNRECKYPLGSTHECRRVVDGGQRNRCGEVHRSLHVKIDTSSRPLRTASDEGRDRGHGQQSSDEISDAAG